MRPHQKRKENTPNELHDTVDPLCITRLRLVIVATIHQALDELQASVLLRGRLCGLRSDEV